MGQTQISHIVCTTPIFCPTVSSILLSAKGKKLLEVHALGIQNMSQISSIRRRQHDLLRHRDRNVLRAEHGRLVKVQEPVLRCPAGSPDDIRLRPDVLHLPQSEGKLGIDH